MRDTWNITPDEARKYILQNWFDGDENVNAFVCGDEEYTAMAIAVEALEATRWYYPSKGEYPPDGKDVVIWFDEVPASTSTHFYKWCKGFFNSLTKEWHGDYKGCPCRLTGVKVICWQYIQPPQEEV